MPKYAKMISRFDPSAHTTLEEAERHYSRVHFPFACNLLSNMRHIRTYHTNRVIRELDIAGGWGQRPTAWRFVLLTFEEDRSLEFDQTTVNYIAQDHLNFLRNLRSSMVTETVPLDRLTGQPTLVKYLIEIDCLPDDECPSQALAAFEAQVLELAEPREELRQVKLNRIDCELEAEAMEEPGQRSTDRLLSGTNKVGFIEIYADDFHWSDTFFQNDKMSRLLRNTPFRISVRAVEERCGLDRSTNL